MDTLILNLIRKTYSNSLETESYTVFKYINSRFIAPLYFRFLSSYIKLLSISDNNYDFLK
jgi:hypothetical protein